MSFRRVTGVVDSKATMATRFLFTNRYSTNFLGGTADQDCVGPVVSTLAITNQLTISAWVRVTTTPSTGGAGVVTTGNSSTAGGVLFVVNGGGFTFSVNTGSAATVSYNGGAYAINTWFHLCGVYDGTLGSANVKFYVNGVSTGTPAAKTGNITGTNNGYLGSYGTATASANFLQGRIDEVSMWNAPLSAAEVGKVYNGGKPTNLQDAPQLASLLYWVRMGDNDLFPIITDNSGHGRDFTMQSMSASNFSTIVP